MRLLISATKADTNVYGTDMYQSVTAFDTRMPLFSNQGLSENKGTGTVLLHHTNMQPNNVVHF